jgi:hypothetical protein
MYADGDCPMWRQIIPIRVTAKGMVIAKGDGGGVFLERDLI